MFWADGRNCNYDHPLFYFYVPSSAVANHTNYTTCNTSAKNYMYIWTLMKIIAFILSIIFFSLAIIPCSDGMTCDDDHTTGQHDHDHSEDEGDGCSPLCFCVCCGTVYVMPDFKDFELTITQIIDVFSSSFSYRQGYSFSFTQSTWHPPLLG